MKIAGRWVAKIGLVVGLMTVPLILGGIVKAETASQAWGPQDRAQFNWNKPASYPVFNSMVDNPKIGDERNFVRVKEYGTEANYTDVVEITPGKEYEVYVFYHNNAAANLNTSGKGIANNVRLKTALPTEVRAGQTAEVKATISATNTRPASVFDTAYLKTKETVYLRYVQNSAVIHNTGSANGKVLDATAMFGQDGVKLAHYQDQWGIIPGCNEFTGYVTYRVKADQPKFFLSKLVSAEGKNDWKEILSVKSEETVDFRLKYENEGTTVQPKVKLFDRLGEGMELVKGSVKATVRQTKQKTNGEYEQLEPMTEAVADDKLTTGLVVGDMNPGSYVILDYKVKVKKQDTCQEKTMFNEAEVATGNGTQYDKAKLVIYCGTTPNQIPETGPAEIALLAVILSGIGLGGGYFWYSKMKLKKLMSNIDESKISIEVNDGEVREE